MPHIIIVGAGVVKLILGQALKLQGIPFTILERDKSANGREQGWAITLHWALPLLEEMLSPELITRTKECRVNPEVAENDARDFKLIDLRDCSEIFNTASGERWRVNRGRFRSALMDGLESNIQWDQHVESVQHHDGFARVQCAKGIFHDADVVIGADGSNSAIRRFLCPEKHEVTPLPYRMLGVGTQLTERQVTPLRSIDKLLFQGSEPGTGTFLYYSLLKPSTKEDSTCTVQLNISWPKRLNEDKVFSDNASRLAAFKSRARDFAPCLKDAIDDIAEGTPVLEILLADWEPVPWTNSGYVTLAGDAAHPMTMFRGEAANHGILDAHDLWKTLKLVYQNGGNMRDAIRGYGERMMTRATDAILKSRVACKDAHGDSVDENSPLVTERTMPQQCA